MEILGGGPAGLYLAYLVKRRLNGASVRVIEQNRSDATFGFGVVFSDRALEFLAGDDPATYQAITPHFESWTDIAIVHRGKRISIDGVGFAAIGRLQLLSILQQQADSVGVEQIYERAVSDLEQLKDADLVVGADGVNSVIRQTHAAEFKTATSLLSNRFAWFGTTKPFDTLTQTFQQTELGYFNAHHYRYAADMSTFIVEVDEGTFQRAGFDRKSVNQAQSICESVFAETLAGHPLISNHTMWRRFPMVWNQQWFHENFVLIGDALRTAHYSIGSGTRLAMEDAIALDHALAGHPGDIPAALADYQHQRQPVVEKLVSAANASAGWYENFPEHMNLSPEDLAMSYLVRSGRVEIERLRQMSPRFVKNYEQSRTIAGNV